MARAGLSRHQGYRRDSAYYGAHMFSETISHFISEHFGKGVYIVFSACLLLGAPLAMLVTTGAALIRHGRETRFGWQIGFCVGIWASLCELCIPYLGMYPNIPGALLGLAMGLGQGAEDTWKGQLCIHGFNLIAWPFLGWALFRMLGQYISRSL